MIEPKRDMMRGFALTGLLCALAGCGESDKPKGATPEDPVEAAAEELGAAVTGCADSGFADNTLTLTLTTEPAVLSAPAGKITVNGYICTGTVATVASTQLTTANVKKIALNGTAGANKVILDMLPGTFGTTILGNMGGITVDYSAGGADSFMIRGGVTPEVFKFGQSTNDIYAEINGDKVADVWIKASGAITLTASMGGGADTVIGNPLPADITTFAGSPVTVATMTNAITAYGGAAVDRFTGGDGNDTFSGGDGDDIFKTGDADDGNDTYIGDANNDTVDYSNRTMSVIADIGPVKPSLVGTADLATLNYGAGMGLHGLTLIIELDDNATDLTVTFANPTSPANVVTQINGTVGLTGVASLTGKNQLMLSSAASLTTSSIELKASTATTLLGLTVGAKTMVSGTTNFVDADDGYAGEGDDIRTTTENITGGSGNDTLFGDAAKNLIKGGAGNDSIMGGGNTTFAAASEADVLQGDAGDDIFYLPIANNWATLTGGLGSNTADFSGRLAALVLSNNGVANDGDNNGDEKVNIGIDILKMIGGFGADAITGGMFNDTLIGGAGGDTLNGGVGADDIVDYSLITVATAATPCFSTTLADCIANDGPDSDNIMFVEHIKGGTAIDTYNATGVTVDVTFEGGAGADVLTGGDGNDTLWGDDGTDTLVGGAGDDNITGGLLVDSIMGGAGDGDICVTDGSDTPVTGCEL